MIEPDYFACNREGLAAYRLGSYETAITYFTFAIEQDLRAGDPSQPRLYDSRAAAYTHMGFFRKAFLDSREVVRVWPDSHRGYLRGARIQFAAERYEQAEKLIFVGLSKVNGDMKGDGAAYKEMITLYRSIQARLYRSSPFSLLPRELFLEIITLATEEYRTPLPFPATSLNSAEVQLASRVRRITPIRFSHVCRSWYATISRTPMLWTSLTLKMESLASTEWKVNFYSARANGKPVGLEKVVLDSGFHRRDQEQEADEGLDDDDRRVERGSGITSLTIAMQDNVFIGNVPDVIAKSKIFLKAVARLKYLFFDIPNNAASLHGVDRVMSAIIRARPLSLERIDFRCDFSLKIEATVFDLCTTFPSLRDLSIRSKCAKLGHSPTIKMEMKSLVEHEVGRTKPFRLERVALEDCEIETRQWRRTFKPDVKYTNKLLSLTSLDVCCRSDFYGWLNALVSTSKLQQYHLRCATVSHERHPSLSDDKRHPDISGLTSLILLKCPLARNAVLDRSIRLGTTFFALINLDLSSVTLSFARLSLFDSSNAPLLATLNLSSTRAQEPVAHLPTFGSLRALDLANASWFTNSHVMELIESTPKLEKLSLTGNRVITGTPLMKFVLSRAAPLEVVVASEIGTATRGWSCLSDQQQQPSSLLTSEAPVIVETKVKVREETCAVVKMEKKEEGKSKKEKFVSGLIELQIGGCPLVEKQAVDWLRKSMRKRGLIHTYEY